MVDWPAGNFARLRAKKSIVQRGNVALLRAKKENWPSRERISGGTRRGRAKGPILCKGSMLRDSLLSGIPYARTGRLVRAVDEKRT
jgi:hypothetical protein